MAPSSDADTAKKPNFVQKLWQKSGLDVFTVLLAMKGALPAVIALAAYESTSFAGIYSTLGYLVAIMANLSLAIQPRAKFLQSLVTNVLFTCMGAALALLEMQCIIAARSTQARTTGVGGSGSQETDTYDGAANTVAAVWLCLWIYLVNVVKYSRPQMMVSVIQFSIFVIVASVYGPSFLTMTQAFAFVRRLLIGFLTGHAIATGVSLFILPVTSRNIATKQMAGLIKVIRGCIASHGAYMDSISTAKNGKSDEDETTAAKQVKDLIIAGGELLGKIKLELSFARKEIAYGKLTPDHFSEIYEKLRLINQPVMGMASFLEIVRSLRDHRAYFQGIPEAQEALEAIRKLEVDEWDDVITISKSAHTAYQNALFAGLDHICYQLELVKRPKNAKQQTANDVEDTAGQTPKPGDRGFAKYLAEELKRYRNSRDQVIAEWAEHRHVSLSDHFWADQSKAGLVREDTKVMKAKLNQHQLYLILYVNYLSNSLGKAVLALAKYADELVENGTMSKKQFIFPGWRRIRKLIASAFTEGSADETLAADVNGGSNVFLGDALNKGKDPEHLPPINAYEKFTDHMRSFPRFLASDASSFAMRVVIASMSIGVVAFLRQSRSFFLTQRGMWALIMTAISMDPHTGQGIFGFLARIFGTIVAAVSAMTIWYMCNKNHAAILVVFLVYLSAWNLFMLKNMQYAMVAMISSVTVILILGYELQVDVIGPVLAASNGQPVFATYILAPFRLATVCIGLGVAFIWTLFPYPITTHGALRKDMGATLYILANYYSCVHTTIEARLKLGPEINELGPTHPIKKLDAARKKVFGKTILMLTSLRTHSNFTKFEPTFGGKFPAETYNELITSVRNLFLYLSLIVYSSGAYTESSEGQTEEDVAEELRWLSDFRQFASETKITSHEITTNLCLLSSAVRSGRPLPPYLRTPRAFAVGDKLSSMDPLLLSSKNLGHPCYAAFAVGEVASAFVTAEMAKVTRLVKRLVGEVDFSFHIMSTTDDKGSMASTIWEKEHASDEARDSGGKGKTRKSE